MISIKQNPSFAASDFREPGSRLPDLRNLGVCLRILIAVNLMALIAAILHASSFNQGIQKLAELSVMLQPILFASLIIFYFTYPWLKKRSYRLGVAFVIGVELFLTWLAHQLGASLFGANAMPPLMRLWLLTLIVTLIMLSYFNLRQRALSPAINEARVQALQARIRPHFLFNSINAVLSILRSDPKRAETALEDMADLFRVLMADNRDLVPLAQEIGLCRQYLALEKLRLEDRLLIDWQIDNIPPDALIPPLILQPLLENAVYHGVEPMPEGGTLTINIQSTDKEVHISLSNPYLTKNNHHAGNKMALKNIRERLSLHFDVEASLKSHTADGLYCVEIIVPYRRRS
jgi:two-component system, LytTR family, sensor histidine kinase AlgZ